MRKVNQKRLINLVSLISDAKQGRFEDVGDINQYFDELQSVLEETRSKTIDSHKKSKECRHLRYKEPTYELVRMVLNYVYVFERVCADCGHKDTFSINHFDGTNYPEGFDGAKKRFYNNNI